MARPRPNSDTAHEVTSKSQPSHTKRRNQNLPNITVSTTTKQSISTGSSFQEFLIHLLDFILRKILTFNIVYKLGLYFLAVTLISVIGDISRPGPSYFSDKHNFLNQYFVKLGWGWTVIIVGSLMLLSVLVSNKGYTRSLSTLAVMTVYWYVCTHSFEWLEDFTGSCTRSGMTSKRPCLREGGNWLGFDISGHCFLLVHSLLFINEESQVILSLSKSLDQLSRSDQTSAKPNLVPTYRLQLRIITAVLCLFTLQWEFMLCVTSLYFHTTVQKLLGMIIALGGWFVVYKVCKLAPEEVQ